MKSRWLLNLALLLLVGGLAVFAWRQTPERDARPPLTAIAPESVQRVTLERPERETVVLERVASGWRLAAPISARASQFAVDNVLRLLTAPVEATIPPSEDLKRYGLDHPALAVGFDGHTVAFGALHPLKDQYYVRSGDTVALVSSRYYAFAGGPYGNFIDTRLIEEGKRLVALKLPGVELALRDGGWQRRPEDPALSSDRINAFVDEWKYARALSVERATGRASGRERIRLEFEAADGTREAVALAIVSRAPELRLLREDEGLVYHFPEDTGKRLLELKASDEMQKDQ